MENNPHKNSPLKKSTLVAHVLPTTISKLPEVVPLVKTVPLIGADALLDHEERSMVQTRIIHRTASPSS